MEPAAASLSLEARYRFRAFNTEVELVSADWLAAQRFGAVDALFHRFEARFSRFRPDSEVGRLNSRRADRFSASGGLRELLQRCRHFAAITAGIFNPLVLRSLEAAGYDRSFEQLPRRPADAHPVAVPPLDVLEVHGDGREIRLPLPLGLDFGGIGKGFAVELARRLLEGSGAYLIDAGGDIYAAGEGPDGDGWRVDVADPLCPERTLTGLWLRDRAIATSWTTKRSWSTTSGRAHHLIDPRTGAPVDNGLVGSTVIAAETDTADVFAKTALILGPRDGVAFLRGQAVEGLLVGADGSRFQTPGWPGQ